MTHEDFLALCRRRQASEETASDAVRIAAPGPMRADELTNPVVRAVVLAIQDGDRKSFFAQFAQSAKLTDDGHPEALAEWVDREIFRAHGRLVVEREARYGVELVGRFHSDQWDMGTAWRFEIVDGRVRRLDVAAL